MTEEGARVDRFAVGWRPRSIHDVRASDARGQRKAACQRFAETNQIRNYLVVFAGEPFPGATEPGVDLVEDEQRAVLVTKPPQQREKCGRRNIDAASDLNRLNQDGADLFPAKEALDIILNAVACRTGVPPVFLDFFQTIVGCLLSQAGRLSYFWKRDEMRELTKLRTERATKVFAMRRVERPIAKTMISALERDDAAFARGQHGGLERGFDCFKAGVAKNCFPASRRREEADRSFASWIPPPHVGGYRPALECEPAQLQRQFRFQGVRMHVAHRVQQFFYLALPRLYHGWIRMAGRRDAKGRCQIEILFTFGIPDMRAARPVPDDRP